MTEPRFVIPLDTITSMCEGIVAGGAELSPGADVHVAPHVKADGLLTKPFIEDGAEPPLKRLFFEYWAPQKLTLAPAVCEPAERSPTTNAPVAVDVNTETVDDAVAAA